MSILSNPFADYTFRCSSLGAIVTKSGDITKGVETFLNEIYYSHIKGFRKEVNSKYMEKGKSCEQAGISLLQSTIFHFLKVPILKNTKREYNAWIEGEHDVKVGKTIVDIKNCWDWITLRNAFLTWDYEWQIRGYMMLNDCDEGILYYSLITPPEEMLVDMEMKMFYQKKAWIGLEDPAFQVLCKEMRDMYDFDKHPKEERFKSFKIERDLKKEEVIKKSVEMCRNRLFQIHLDHQSEHRNNKFLMGLS